MLFYEATQSAPDIPERGLQLRVVPLLKIGADRRGVRRREVAEDQATSLGDELTLSSIAKAGKISAE